MVQIFWQNLEQKYGISPFFQGFSQVTAKIAKLKPLHKKGSKANPENFRLISLLLWYQRLLKK